MTQDDKDDKGAELTDVDAAEASEPDENMRIFIYGNIKIRDVGTGEILVNKRF